MLDRRLPDRWFQFVPCPWIFGIVKSILVGKVVGSTAFIGCGPARMETLALKLPLPATVHEELQDFVAASSVGGRTHKDRR